MKTKDKLKEWGQMEELQKPQELTSATTGKYLMALWTTDFCRGTVYEVLQKDFKYRESKSSGMKDKAN